jgi:hypothetical protein
VTVFSRLCQTTSRIAVAKIEASRLSSLSSHAKVQSDLTPPAAEQEAGEAREEGVPMHQEQDIEVAEVQVIAKVAGVDEVEVVQLVVDSVAEIVEDVEEAGVVASTRIRLHHQHQQTLPLLLLLPTPERCIAKYPFSFRYG